MSCIIALAAMNWDCGMLSMEYKVKQKKLMFLHYLVQMDDENLAKQVFNAQNAERHKPSRLPV